MIRFAVNILLASIALLLFTLWSVDVACKPARDLYNFGPVSISHGRQSPVIVGIKLGLGKKVTVSVDRASANITVDCRVSREHSIPDIHRRRFAFSFNLYSPPPTGHVPFDVEGRAAWIAANTVTEVQQKWLDTTQPFCLGLGLPFWLTFVLFASYPVVSFVRGPLRKWRRHKHGMCLKCGYNLKGNVSGVCSECGEPVLQQAERTTL